jgi:hypothetical protein
MAAMATRTTFDQVTELRDLVVDYAKQETVDPLRSLGRYLGFGLAGGVCIGGGVGLLLLGLLRGLQDVSWFDAATHAGGWRTWVPYGVTIVAGVLIVAISVMAARRSTSKRRSPT